MGSNNLPPEGPEEPQDGSGEAIEGEVLPYGFLPDDGRYSRSFKDQQSRRTRWGSGHLDDDDVAEVIAQYAKQVPVRKIAQQFGISYETVRQWGKAHHQKRMQDSGEVLKHRADVLIQFETIAREAWKMYEASTHPVVKKDALARVESANRAIARLTGAEAPIKVKAEVDVTEVDPMDIKLREMINEQRARNAASREQVEQQFKAGT